jgi:CheY-like chemotaxis protein
MVYGIVKQCGGHLEVESQPGLGTTFRLFFPRSAESRATPPRPEHGPVTGPTGETILLVEDEFPVRKLARHCLAGHGYHVLEAANGGEALLLCERHPGPIDLLLTDVVMPKLNGRQLAERLLAMRPEMKVMFMSGYTDELVLPRGIATTDNSFLQKPFTPQSLLEHVQDLLHGSGARQVLCETAS